MFQIKKTAFKAAAGGGVAKRISLKPLKSLKQGDGIDNWDMLASSEAEKVPSARTEIIIVAQASGSIRNQCDQGERDEIVMGSKFVVR